MAELMGDTLSKKARTGSSETTEVMPLIGVPMQNNPFDLLPPEIFDRVFRLLDKRSLRQTRLVCREWNDFALEILSKTPGSVKHLIKYYGGKLWKESPERIQKLQSILSLTEYPEMFFSELFLSQCVLELEIGLLNLLQQFGSTLKSLKLIYTSLNLHMLRAMLESWCINLEELSLIRIVVTEDTTISIQDFETPPTLLKLNLRKFYVHDSHDQPLTAAQNFLVSIVKTSPKLQVLDVHDVPGFWKKIEKFPNVTKKLEEVQFTRVRYAEGISELIDVSFSNKLTFLKLIILGGLFPKEQLVRLLEKVAESLEKLVIHLIVYLDLKKEFPVMKKLKLLEYISHPAVFFDPIDFLKKLPNLEILRLSWYDRFVNLTYKSEFVDAFFSNAWYLIMSPYKTLNTLSVKGSPKNPETIFAINRIFPNLRDFAVAVDCSEIPDSEKEGWLIGICAGLAEMENLKILRLFSHDALKWDKFNFEACFNPLVASKSLEELNITHDRKMLYCRDPDKFPPGLEKVLIKIPKLKFLTLHRFYLEKSESLKLFSTLVQKNILLKESEGGFW